MRRAWYRSAPYHRLLSWQPQTTLRQALPLRPADGSRRVAEAVLDGRLPLAGKSLPFGTLPWSVPPPGSRAAAAIHGFAWLLDLKALGTAAARARAQDLVRGWIRANPRWNEQAWQPGILGRRLVAWITCADFVLADQDASARDAFYRSLNMQARHLVRDAANESGTEAAFAALLGRIAATIALGVGSLPAAVALLEREIDRQILADGCHVQRNPEVHLAVLRDLLDIRTMLADADAEMPLFLADAIERMVAMLRFFRHGDGGLALFNGGKEADVHRIDSTLAEAGVKERPPASAPAGGFERIATGPALIIVDAGGPPPAGADRLAHAAPAAFEMSVGRERLIVNCGGYAGDDARWRAAMRSTAAHSTAMVDNVNAVALGTGAGVHGRRPDVGVVRRSAESVVWLEVDHDGYGSRFGAVCRRRLYMDALGEDIRGEDVCEGRGGERFVVRFHLHPRVEARLEDGRPDDGVAGIRLTLPSGAAYRFISIGGTMTLDDSVYLGVSDVPQPTRQIVVSGAITDKVTRIKWALRRVDQDQRGEKAPGRGTAQGRPAATASAARDEAAEANAGVEPEPEMESGGEPAPEPEPGPASKPLREGSGP
jgi:uncharacterized heparinase superfamily protein